MINKILLIMDPCGLVFSSKETNSKKVRFICCLSIYQHLQNKFEHCFNSEDECSPSIISCPYARMGCQTKIQRQAVASHLESATRVHLDIVSIKLRETEEAMELLHTTTFIWKIDCCSEALKQAKIGEKSALYSDPFHTKTGTDSYGYKMKVLIYPNGNGTGKNTYLSVFIIVMKGEYDAILPWPFKKKVKFELIDQQEDPAQQENVTKEIRWSHSRAFSRPTEEGNPGRGFGQFVSHTKLNTRQYIVDDTLFLRITISSPTN
ncbi:unnamed protein product [Pocillopora meandrina]|uniref:MATH domain-containing protein n=1 Tax=Pocillopora meandrina TaxID=46732 RepID=A0AAU9WWM2_9CNID|nr:unnamed protein product [Pocillopora meandrina]